MNAVTVTGNLARDPELRYTQGGRACCTAGVAVNRRWQQNGEWNEAVSFFNVVAWGDLAENVAASLTKGARVIVTGRLEQRSWETDSAEKRTVVEIVADEIGPSLRWATASVDRIARDDAGPAAGSRASGAGGRAHITPDDEEEPF